MSREHANEWVEVDRDTWLAQPEGTWMRQDWVRGVDGGGRFFVHRDDLLEPDAGRVRWCNCADAPWDGAKCREGECRESWRDAGQVRDVLWPEEVDG